MTSLGRIVSCIYDNSGVHTVPTSYPSGYSDGSLVDVVCGAYAGLHWHPYGREGYSTDALMLLLLTLSFLPCPMSSPPAKPANRPTRETSMPTAPLVPRGPQGRSGYNTCTFTCSMPDQVVIPAKEFFTPLPPTQHARVRRSSSSTVAWASLRITSTAQGSARPRLASPATAWNLIQLRPTTIRRSETSALSALSRSTAQEEWATALTASAMLRPAIPLAWLRVQKVALVIDALSRIQNASSLPGQYKYPKAKQRWSRAGWSRSDKLGHANPEQLGQQGESRIFRSIGSQEHSNCVAGKGSSEEGCVWLYRWNISLRWGGLTIRDWYYNQDVRGFAQKFGTSDREIEGLCCMQRWRFRSCLADTCVTRAY